MFKNCPPLFLIGNANGLFQKKKNREGVEVRICYGISRGRLFKEIAYGICTGYLIKKKVEFPG